MATTTAGACSRGGHAIGSLLRSIHLSFSVGEAFAVTGSAKRTSLSPNV